MARRTLTDRKALITGASSGIGRAIAKRLAESGVHLLLTARREDRLRELTRELESADVQVEYVAGDITDSELRQELARHCDRLWGQLDLLINNAGIGAIGSFLEADEDQLRRVMEVNFFAPVELIRQCQTLLRNGQSPMVVNVASVLGHRAVPTKVEYCASKFALHGFSDALRAELAGAGIDVLIVSPSTTRSEFFDALGNTESQAGANKRDKRGMAPERVAMHTVRAIQQGRHEVILSVGGKLLVWLDRLSPPLMNRLIGRFG